MELVRTVRVKLLPTPEQMKVMEQTLAANVNALNYASQVAFDQGGISKTKTLQPLIYNDLRAKFGLKSQMACNVSVAVAGTYASAKSNKRLKLATFRHSKLTYSYNRDYGIQEAEKTVSLSVIQGGRITVPFLVAQRDLHYFAGDEWQWGSAELMKRGNGYYFHVSAKCEVDMPTIGDVDAFIGSDRGMRFLSAAVNDQGKVQLYRGNKVKQKRAEYVRLRKTLQQKGTRSAKRKLKKVAGRENRYMTDVNHCVANELIRFAKASGEKPCIVLEDLTGINQTTSVRLRDRYWRFSWAFAQLETFIRYKALAEGILVINVPEKYTSQQCPKCGHTEKANRNRKKHLLKCKECGYQVNDDLAAAMNIRDRGIAEWQRVNGRLA